MKDRYGPIYRPAGKAGEYADWALNLYSGCPHRCAYCYVPVMLRRDRAQWYAQSASAAVPIAKIERAACRMQADGIAVNVMLSFTCDPYPGDGLDHLTREAIQALTRHGHCVSVLTKAGARARRDLDLLAKAPGSRFWVTLTCMDEAMAARQEPGAAPPSERLANLAAAKAAGVPTAVSLEPILSGSAAWEVIDAVSAVADHVYLGRANYVGLELDWAYIVPILVRELEARGMAYSVKKDLATAANWRRA